MGLSEDNINGSDKILWFKGIIPLFLEDINDLSINWQIWDITIN